MSITDRLLDLRRDFFRRHNLDPNRVYLGRQEWRELRRELVYYWPTVAQPSDAYLQWDGLEVWPAAEGSHLSMGLVESETC